MNEPESKSFFARLHAPMAAPAYYRRTGYAYLALAAFLAVTALVLGALSIADRAGMVILGLFALLATGPGLWRLRKAAKANPETVVHQTLDTAPPALQEAMLRRQIPLAAIAFPLMTLMTANSLLKLENGEVDSVRVWAPLALMYGNLGFWPTVLAGPCLGAFTIFALVRKLQVLRERAK
jgi:hypothetical protein